MSPRLIVVALALSIAGAVIAGALDNRARARAALDRCEQNRATEQSERLITCQRDLLQARDSAHEGLDAYVRAAQDLERCQRATGWRP